MNKFIPFARLALSSWIAGLLGWCGAALATTGVTLSYTKQAPLNIADLVIGLVLMIVHRVMSHLTLRAASNSTSVKPLPPGVSHALIFCAAMATLALGGCASQSANLTTTAASEAATVDNAGTIAAGAGVTSANTASGTTVASITGTNISLSIPATATGTVSAAFKNTVAVQFQDDITSYTQTLALAVQTDAPVLLADIGNAAKMTADVGTLLQEWGLTPVNATQRTTVGNIIQIANQVGTSAASLSTVLTGISTTGTVPVVTTSSSAEAPPPSPGRKLYTVARDSAGMLVYSF